MYITPKHVILSLLNAENIVLIFQSECSGSSYCSQSCAAHNNNREPATDSAIHLFKDLKAGSLQMSENKREKMKH